MRKHSRTAFSLFQLLVLLGIGGLLFGLFFPAVLKLRVAAARAQSTNNLKQIALASQNYADVNNKLAPGRDDHGFSAFAYILPYLDQENVFRMIDFTKSIDNEKNLPARKILIPTYLNNQDKVGIVKDGYGPTSYLFNAGSRPSLKDNDGLFYQDSKVRFPVDIPDGTSNTVMAVETLKGDGGKNAVDVKRQYVKLDEKELGNLNDDSGVEDFKKDQHIAGDRCASWMNGAFLQGTFTATRLPDDPKPDVACGGVGGLAGPRTLGGLFQAAMGDGSVRSIETKRMKLEVWKALNTRNGGEVIPNDF